MVYKLILEIVAIIAFTFFAIGDYLDEKIFLLIIDIVIILTSVNAIINTIKAPKR